MYILVLQQFWGVTLHAADGKEEIRRPLTAKVRV